MPLCPQITMTPVTVTSSGITMGYVKPVIFASNMIASSLLGTLYSSTAPVAFTIGQLWADTAHGNKLYRCSSVGTITNAAGSGTTVTYTTDAPHGLIVGQLISIAEIDPNAYNLTGVTVATVPTTTTFTVTNAATGTYVEGGWVAGWTLIQDTAIADAKSTADLAWSAALGKNTVFYQTTMPSTSGRVAGDVWFDTDDGNKMYGFDGASWVAYQFGTASFQNASIDLNKLASGSVDASKILTGAVTYGKIAAGAVGATEIAANSIVAGNIAAAAITGDRIAANTLTATNIAAGSITTDRLIAGTLTGFSIYNGSGTFQVDAYGNLTATSANVTGTITSTNATIANLTVDSTSLRSPGYSLNLYGTPVGGWDIVTSNAIATGTLQAQYIGGGGSPIDVTTNLKNSGAPTVTGTNNVILSASNVFQKNTASSQRFKHDIIDIGDVPELDPSLLLQIPVRAFKYNADYLAPTDSRSDVFVPGMIAEEVDAVYPVAIEYDGELHDGPPLVWNPTYIIPGMLALIQQQATKITDLETRLSALEARL